MLGLDLFCISTSDYEFSDLRSLMIHLFVVVLSRIAKGEIVRDICDVIS